MIQALCKYSYTQRFFIEKNGFFVKKSVGRCFGY